MLLLILCLHAKLIKNAVNNNILSELCLISRVFVQKKIGPLLETRDHNLYRLSIYLSRACENRRR